MTKTDIENSGLGLESSDRIQEGGTLFVRTFGTPLSSNLISVIQFDSDPTCWIVRLDKTIHSPIHPEGKIFPPFTYRVKTIRELKDLIEVYTAYEAPK